MITSLIILAFLNGARATSTPVVINPALAQVAQARADYLCDRRQWSHDGWLDLFKGKTSKYAGENLAMRFPNPVKASEAWMASPPHRANMLKDKYRVIGVGESEKCKLIVLLFADKYENATTTNKVP